MNMSSFDIYIEQLREGVLRVAKSSPGRGIICFVDAANFFMLLGGSKLVSIRTFWGFTISSYLTLF